MYILTRKPHLGVLSPSQQSGVHAGYGALGYDAVQSCWLMQVSPTALYGVTS